MRNVSRAKGVADMRTAVSTHYRSASRHEGTPYLEILALGMEKLRLEKELAMLGKREERIRKRLAEIKTLMETRVSRVQDDDPPRSNTSPSGEQPAPGGGPWRKMTVGY
jgi:hypothetical protein